LSNERTHLSYLRTAISLVSFGITLNRFSIYLQEKKDVGTQSGALHLRDTENVGAGMVVLGLLILIWSLYRYRLVSQAIEAGNYNPRHRMVLILTLGILFLGGISAVWLFWMANGH
jgi:putative membrane protein